MAERKALIDRTHALSVSQQTRLVGIARSSVYYRAQPVREADQLLIPRIDALHLEFPFAGARMLARLLRREGHESGRRRVRTLMKRMGRPGAVRQAEHEPAQCAAQDLAIPAAWHEDRAGQSGVRARYDLHSDGTRLCVPDGGGGLSQSQDTRAPGRHHAGSVARG